MLNLPFRPFFRAVLIIAAVALCYFATGRLLLALSAPPNGAVTTVWLPSGITVAALIVFGPLAAIGSFIGSVAGDLKASTPLPGALIVGLANAASEFLCYYLIIGPDKRVFTIVEAGSVLRLVLAALASSALSACIGVTAYVSYGVLPAAVYWSSWLAWFGSAWIGIILITPFLVYSVGFRASFGKGSLRCGAALGALAIAAFLWQGPEVSRNSDQPVVLVVILALLWIAFRFPPATMTLAVFTFAVSAVGGAVFQISQEPHSSELTSIFTLQIMLGALAMIGYLLSSMVEGQKRATEGLRLAAKVYDTTNEGIVVTTADGSIIDANSAFSRITGYSRAEALGQNLRFMISERQPPEFFDAMLDSLSCSSEWQGEVWQQRADGTTLPTWLSIATVRDDKGLTREHVGVFSDITELRETQSKLMATARQAGMAEIATNVLHNVGNVLNNVNISADLVASRIRNSKAHGIARAIGLVNEHAADLSNFLTQDDRGKMLPEYLNKLSGALAAEHESIVEELERLTKSIGHIKGIIATQQSYAGASSMVETVQVRELVEDALATNAESLRRHQVAVVKEFEELPLLSLDKPRVLLILVNLISNARQALLAAKSPPPQITLRFGIVDTAEGRKLQICVADNGAGIPPENLDRIFAHGFTTRKDGHGFGLHSCALAAGEMGGALKVESAGPGKGATFTLELPATA